MTLRDPTNRLSTDRNLTTSELLIYTNPLARGSHAPVAFGKVPVTPKGVHDSSTAAHV